MQFANVQCQVLVFHAKEMQFVHEMQLCNFLSPMYTEDNERSGFHLDSLFQVPFIQIHAYVMDNVFHVDTNAS